MRKVKDRRAMDFYETPEGLTQELLTRLPDLEGAVVLEPFVGDGAIVSVLRQWYGDRVEIVTNDLDPEREADYHVDASTVEGWSQLPAADWVITNGPFRLADWVAPLVLDHVARLDADPGSGYPPYLRGAATLWGLNFQEPTQGRGKRPGRAPFWDAWADYEAGRVTFGGPRPSFTGDGNTYFMTTSWYVFMPLRAVRGMRSVYVHGWDTRKEWWDGVEV